MASCAYDLYTHILQVCFIGTERCRYLSMPTNTAKWSKLVLTKTPTYIVLTECLVQTFNLGVKVRDQFVFLITPWGVFAMLLSSTCQWMIAGNVKSPLQYPIDLFRKILQTLKIYGRKSFRLVLLFLHAILRWKFNGRFGSNKVRQINHGKDFVTSGLWDFMIKHL